MKRRSPPGNLPVQPTPLIGRANELAELRRMLEEHRLVTVAGVGGVGKTRTALELASSVAERFEDGTWLSQLASLTDRRLVAQAIAAPFSGKIPLGEAPFQSLAGILEKKSALLLIDGCELLIESVAKLAVTLLTRCPQITIVTTSRVPLDIAGEAIYRLPSLALPPETSVRDARSAAGFDAVALFVERANTSEHHFRLDDRNAASVVDVCRKVDGIPLAIEIAAAHMDAMTPGNLAARLDERLQMLRRGSRTAFSRQQTMQGLLEWSFDLLDESERILFARLAIFSNAWSATDAVAVCSDAALDSVVVSSALASLRGKALVAREAGSDGTRFRLLEPLRDFAAERLNDRNERETTRRAHGEYFLAKLISGGARPLMPRSRTWMAQIDGSLADIRSALAWAIDEGHDLVNGARAAIAFHEYTERRNLPEEALAHLTAVRVAAAALDPTTQLDVAITEGHASVDFGLSEPDVDALVARARELGDQRATTGALSLAIHVRAFAGQRIEPALVEEALDHARACDDPYLLGRIIGLGGFLGGVAPDYTRACFEEAIAKLAPYDDALCIASLYNNWGEFEYEEANFERALELSERGRAIATNEPGLERAAVMADVNRAMYALATNQPDRAALYAADALAATRGLRDPMYVLLSLCAMLHLARVAERQERAEVAASIVGYIEETLGAQHIKLQFHEQHQLDALLSSLRSVLGIEGYSVRAMEGAGWSTSQACDETLAAFKSPTRA